MRHDRAFLTVGLATVLIGAAAIAAGPEQEAEQTTQATICWMEWSDEAFARAAAEKKPILLNIRVEWAWSSNWIEQNVYRNPEVVEAVNENWIPIRVDRDRRPDIDSRYQIAVFAVSRQAGWPLTAMLSETGEVLYGRSYIHVEDRRRNPGLLNMLRTGAEGTPGSPPTTLAWERLMASINSSAPSAMYPRLYS